LCRVYSSDWTKYIWMYTIQNTNWVIWRFHIGMKCSYICIIKMISYNIKLNGKILPKNLKFYFFIKIILKSKLSWVWQNTPVIQYLGGWGRRTESLRPAWQVFVLKKKQKQNQKIYDLWEERRREEKKPHLYILVQIMAPFSSILNKGPTFHFALRPTHYVARHK
jgi:hypothetical protein